MGNNVFNSLQTSIISSGESNTLILTRKLNFINEMCMKLRLFFGLCSLIFLNETHARELFILGQPDLFSCENMQENLKPLLVQNPKNPKSTLIQK